MLKTWKIVSWTFLVSIMLVFLIGVLLDNYADKLYEDNHYTTTELKPSDTGEYAWVIPVKKVKNEWEDVWETYIFCRSYCCVIAYTFYPIYWGATISLCIAWIVEDYLNYRQKK